MLYGIIFYGKESVLTNFHIRLAGKKWYRCIATFSSAFLYTVKGSVSTEFNGRVDSIKAIELLLLLFITHKLDVKHVKIKKLFTGAVICS